MAHNILLLLFHDFRGEQMHITNYGLEKKLVYNYILSPSNYIHK